MKNRVLGWHYFFTIHIIRHAKTSIMRYDLKAKNYTTQTSLQNWGSKLLQHLMGIVALFHIYVSVPWHHSYYSIVVCTSSYKKGPYSYFIFISCNNFYYYYHYTMKKCILFNGRETQVCSSLVAWRADSRYSVLPTIHIRLLEMKIHSKRFPICFKNQHNFTLK